MPLNMPWLSPLGLSSGTPLRRPGSVRRTTSVDILWPDGIGDDLDLVGVGRDLLTKPDGEAEVLATATTRVSVASGMVQRIRSTPAIDVDGLLGVKAKGFRRSLDVVHPSLGSDGSLVGLLLDEVPVTTLISRAAPRFVARSVHPQHALQPITDICAGWIAGGVREIALRSGALPDRIGSVETPLDSDDALAWHEMGELREGCLRRRRRLDVWRQADSVLVEGVFRDIMQETDGSRTVIHEYVFGLTAHAVTHEVQAVGVEGRALPNSDCPAAIASAQRIVGLQLEDLRGHVRAEFDGPSTCTHLNDSLRSLGDVHALLSSLPDPRGQ